MDNTWMTNREVADFLRVQVQTINRWRCTGKWGFDKMPVKKNGPMGKIVLRQRGDVEQFGEWYFNPSRGPDDVFELNEVDSD